MGTGGTVAGVSEVLETRNPSFRAVAVGQFKSPVISRRTCGREPNPAGRRVQGPGPGFIPGVFDLEVVDEAIPVEEKSAFETARRLAPDEGIPCRVNSGAAAWAIPQMARWPEASTKLIVLPDLGQRYLSMALWPAGWPRGGEGIGSVVPKPHTTRPTAQPLKKGPQAGPYRTR